MQCDVEVRPALAQRPDDALDGKRGGPGHGVGKGDVFERDGVLLRYIEDLLDQRHDPRDRNITLEIAAERSHDAAAFHRSAGALVALDNGVLLRKLLRCAAVLIAQREFFGRRKLKKGFERALQFSDRLANSGTIQTPLRGAIPRTTSSASAMPGTALGLTNETT